MKKANDSRTTKATAVHPRNSKRIAIFAAAALILLLLASVVFADYWSARPLGIQASYVGRSACVDCHHQEIQAFSGSHHDLAMDLATDEFVLGDFDNATLEYDGMTSRMFRDGDRFMVHTDGETGQMQDFEVKYVFGVEPLQQYMVEFDRRDDMPENEIARLQVLRISWDTQNKRWFYLRPPDVDEKLKPDDPLHWTGVAQRWQTMCADCHSTNLKRHFDPKTTQYQTTFSEIDVSCEACHGPGSLHLELANEKSLFWDRNYGYGLASLKGDDPEPQLQTCAPCHSRRGVLTGDFKAGDLFHDHFNLELPQESTYFADGQIKDEVYVYGSFIQSKMYHKGIRCTDCHDPHSLKLKSPGNQTCTSCHQHAAGKYDVPSHHHHVPGTPGAMCVNCHMPHRTYMEVDARRDHSLRVPRPDLSVKLGTPNACSGCHVRDQLESIGPLSRTSLKEYAHWLEAAEQGNDEVAKAVDVTNQWCDDACEKWYGKDRKQPRHFSEAIVAFRRGNQEAGKQDSGQKELGHEKFGKQEFEHQEIRQKKVIQEMLRMAVQPSEFTPALMRAAALSELSRSGAVAVTPAIEGVVDDRSEHPIVRAAAIGLFMQAHPLQVHKTLMPLIADPSRLVRTEAARVLVASGAYRSLNPSEKSKVDLRLREVKEAFMTAPDRAGAHMGWAMICEGQGRFQEAADAYETAIRVEPKMAGPRSNLAVLLDSQRIPADQAGHRIQRIEQLRREELPLLGRDADLAPENPIIQHRYGLALYLAGEMDKALERLNRAVELAPDDPRFRQARDLLKKKLER